jgi:hypothetical protein
MPPGRLQVPWAFIFIELSWGLTQVSGPRFHDRAALAEGGHLSGPTHTTRWPVNSVLERDSERSMSAGRVESRSSARNFWCPPRTPNSRPL